MSTNYYFTLKKEKVEKIMEMVPFADEILLNRMFIYKIGRSIEDRKPVFFKTPHYKSVREIREFYKKYEDILDVQNDYGDSLTWSQLEKDLIEQDSIMEDKGEDNNGCIRLDDDGYRFLESHSYL